jgi:hypothetical protein
VVAGRALEQTPVGLDIQTYGGLTITGAVGTVYSVESVTFGTLPFWKSPLYR